MEAVVQTTRAQDRSIIRLAKKHGSAFIIGYEPDGATVRVRVQGDEPAKDRERIVTPSGLVLEPVA